MYEEEFSRKKVDWRMWLSLLRYARGSARNLALVAVFMILCAVGDIVSPFIMAHLIDQNILKGTTAGSTPWIVLVFAAAVAQGSCTYVFIANAMRADIGVTCDLRRLGFRKLQELSFSYYDRTPVGYIMARLTSDASRLGDTLAWSLVDFFWSIAYSLLAGAAMLIVNWRLGLLLVGVLPVVAVVSLVIRKFILAAQRRVRRANSRITGAFNEGIGGAKTTKTLVLERKNIAAFQNLTTDMYRQSVRSALVSSLLMPLVLCIGSVSTALLLWKGGVTVLAGGITLGEFSFFIWLGSMYFEPINNLTRIFSDLQSSQAALERVISLLETEPEITESEGVLKKFGGTFDARPESWPKLKGGVVFDHVSFRYREGRPVLSDFCLRVRPGERIALVGETGGGKSTIVNLLCRFYEPTEGRILIDGVDYRERPQSWLHANLGYVLQSPHLFSGTVRENIRYGRLDATDGDVEEVARLIHADAFIERLEHGYDTEVGEGGNRLSTGEKQLISFARAILAAPPLFILDEATSSIDTEAELSIKQAMETTLAGRTSFIIAHRLSTVRSADRILVIGGGVIREEGSHAELMRRRGHYYELYTSQFREEESNKALGFGGPVAE